MPAEFSGPRLHVREVDIDVRPPVENSFQLLNAPRVLLGEFLDSFRLSLEHESLLQS